MAAIHSRDTTPEMYVRRAVHAAGFRYALNRRDLPGKPDLVFTRYRVVAFVHGCFWHGHTGCTDGRLPKTNLSYWAPKIASNRLRDRRSAAALRRVGWSVITIRECTMRRDTVALITRLSGLRARP